MFRPSGLKNKEYYLFEGFPDSNLLCASSSRSIGNTSLVYGQIRNSLENRGHFLGNFGINYKDLICAKQIHGSNVKYVTTQDRGKGALSYETSISDTDAFITDKKNLPLAVFTADCLSIFLYDPIKSAIGLIHAGWRSTKENITAETVQLMQEKFNTRAKDLYAALGPSIRDCCYEVGNEFSDFFLYGLVKRDNRYYLDLARMNKKQLLDSGVKDLNIFDSKICTSCRNEEFFSYRKEGKNCSRTMSVIMLK